MHGKRMTIVPAALALAIAIGVIVFGTYAGIPINQTNTVGLAQSTSGSTNGSVGAGGAETSSSSTIQAASASISGSAYTSPPTSSPSSSGPGQGTLSILLTDPPNIPKGVSKLYISYSELEVHVSHAGNQSGWTLVQSSGQVELLGTVNVSQTLSSVKLATGDYNEIRFNITSAAVTFDGGNYTAFVQSAELIVPIVNGIPVNATGSAAAIIDISPTVINIGSSSTPEFIIKSVALAYPVPGGQVTTQMQQPGTKMSLIGAGWWSVIMRHQSSNLVMGDARLNASGLGLAISNKGNTSTRLALVVVSPLVSPAATGYLPGSFMGTALFAILPNGTLVPLRYMGPLSASADSRMSISSTVFQGIGYNLTTGATANLSYGGVVRLGFLTMNALQGSIVPGQQYVITVVGTQSSVSTVVVAS
jgi:hypothetical protein